MCVSVCVCDFFLMVQQLIGYDPCGPEVGPRDQRASVSKPQECGHPVPRALTYVSGGPDLRDKCFSGVAQVLRTVPGSSMYRRFWSFPLNLYLIRCGWYVQDSRIFRKSLSLGGLGCGNYPVCKEAETIWSQVWFPSFCSHLSCFAPSCHLTSSLSHSLSLPLPSFPERTSLTVWVSSCCCNKLPRT